MHPGFWIDFPQEIWNFTDDMDLYRIVKELIEESCSHEDAYAYYEATIRSLLAIANRFRRLKDEL